MLDMNLIRENPELVRTAMKHRQMDSEPVDRAVALDDSGTCHFKSRKAEQPENHYRIKYYIYDRSGQGAYHRKQHISCSLQYFFDTELYKSEER